MTTLNTIKIVNGSNLDSNLYTVWVAGFIAAASPDFYILEGGGSFSQSPTAAQTAPFHKVGASGLTINVPSVTNYGNNRLIFVVTPAGASDISYPMDGYTAYPFPGQPGACPPGPYDILEFGPNAKYDVSAVDSFGINLSFTVDGDSLIYGVNPTIKRKDIGTAFCTFIKTDSPGVGFDALLYSSPASSGYPPLIDNQFSAIVSPKDWLAIFPEAPGLATYWQDTVDAFFKSGNQLNFFLNGATVGTYAGSSDGNCFFLNGPSGPPIRILKKNFQGNQPFLQAVGRGSATFGQIEAALFAAFSRGVALDGVVAAGRTIRRHYSSDAWTNTANWFTHHRNAYNGCQSVYDAYAKFLHFGQVGLKTIYGPNAAGTAMAYGFSLDENPNVGSTALDIPPNSWPATQNVPSETSYDVENQTVTVTIGPWA